MSYTLGLQCGCTVYVSCHPRTRIAHTRVIERRGDGCQSRKHRVGERLWIWEMLPDPRHTCEPRFAEHVRWNDLL